MLRPHDVKLLLKSNTGMYTSELLSECRSTSTEQSIKLGSKPSTLFDSVYGRLNHLIMSPDRAPTSRLP